MPQYRRQKDGAIVSETVVRSGFDGSLPAVLNDAIINSLGFDFIKDTPKPTLNFGQAAVEKIEQGANGKWYQNWEVIALEQNVETIKNPGVKVARLRGVTYTRADDGQRASGLIAQDVQAVLPDAVKKNPDGSVSLDYGNVIGLLVESIKELQAEINALKAK